MVDTPATTLQKEVHHGLTGGMNRAVAVHELPEGQHHTIYDAILDNPGFIRQRGPVAALGANVALATYDSLWGSLFSNRSANITAGQTANLYEVVRTGATPGLYIRANGTNRFLSTLTGGTPSATDVYQVMPALRHGTMIGRNAATYNLPGGGLLYHAGAQDTSYSTGTMSVTRGTTLVTGVGSTWTSLNGSAAGGWFLCSLNGDTLYGTVKTILTNTTLSLADGSLATAAAATYKLVPVRGVVWRLAKGRITTATGAAIVTGALTKFLAASSTGRTYDLFRLSDLTYVGTVTSIQSDRQLTLTANAAIAMANERYILIPRGTANLYDGTANANDKLDTSLTCVYAGRQFYANSLNSGLQAQYTLWFSDPADMEAVDFSQADGDFIVVSSQGNATAPITGMFGMQNGLAIFKDRELWMLSGDDPTNFVLNKVADIGTWTHTSIVPWRGTIIFAAREGILQFDGVRLRNLTAELADFYRSNNTSNTSACPAFVYRNHYVIWMNGMSGGATVRKGAVATTETNPTIVINLETGALTLFSNCRFTAACQLGADFGAPAASAGDVAFSVKQSTAAGPAIASASSLFTSGTAADTYTSSGGALGIGPNFYVETKAFDLGDPERRKYWKEFAASYFANGSSLTLDAVLGIGSTTTGTVLADTLAASGTMTRKRARVFLHDTHVRFRIYPTSNGVLQNTNIGTFSVRGRPMRFGRVA